MNRTHLELTDVGIDFPTPKGPFTALQNVNLKVGEGEFVSLMEIQDRADQPPKVGIRKKGDRSGLTATDIFSKHSGKNRTNAGGVVPKKRRILTTQDWVRGANPRPASGVLMRAVRRIDRREPIHGG